MLAPVVKYGMPTTTWQYTHHPSAGASWGRPVPQGWVSVDPLWLFKT